MNYRMIKFIVGKMLLMEGVLLLIPAFVSLLYQESSGVYFLIVTAALLVLSLLLSRKPEDTSIYAKEGFVVVALAWLLVSDQVSEELLCRINAELFPVVSCTDAFSHPADFRHACNFSLENFPDHESVARAMVEKLNLQLKQRRKETV